MCAFKPCFIRASATDGARVLVEVSSIERIVEVGGGRCCIHFRRVGASSVYVLADLHELEDAIDLASRGGGAR